ncbi:hypothetical protein PybrP1_003011 [[Pythium] brassicae (nom. inval.)]|nr:hypothetical protein PybrP1_003011 [[Pythium] brassicae (nom. inval.)]
MKRERSTTTSAAFAHARTSSVEFARAVAAAAPQLLQSAREELALVHKRLRRGFAGSFSSSSSSSSSSSTSASSSHPHSHSHRRQGSTVKAAVLSSACVHTNPATPASTSSYASPMPSTIHHHHHQQQHAPPPHSSAAAQLQFYGFYSTTAFDRAAISPAEALLLAAEMAADFFSEASMLYDMLSEIKSPTDEVRAVDELMTRMQSLLHDDARLPKAPAEVTAAQVGNVRNVYSGLVRVYIFLFQRHYREFVELEVSELLAASWQRLLAFAAEYKILDEEFILQVFDYVKKLVNAFKC